MLPPTPGAYDEIEVWLAELLSWAVIDYSVHGAGRSGGYRSRVDRIKRYLSRLAALRARG